MKTKKSNWEKEARRIFQPYARELSFEELDWDVFLARLAEVREQARQEGIEEMIRFALSGIDDTAECPEKYIERYNTITQGKPSGRAWVMWFIDQYIAALKKKGTNERLSDSKT